MIRDRIKSFERIAVRLLDPYPLNPRMHPENQRQAMTAALTEIGYADALIVRPYENRYQILDGHLRAEVTPDEEVPCLVVDLTDEEAAKFILTHDPIGDLAEYDLEKLEELKGDMEFELEPLNLMLADLMGLEEDTDIVEDPIPDLLADPITQAGDIWRCGRHQTLLTEFILRG